MELNGTATSRSLVNRGYRSAYVGIRMLNIILCLICNYRCINCFVDIDDCQPNPCANGGSCTDGVNSYTCTCAEGYTGPNCNTSKYSVLIIELQRVQPEYNNVLYYICIIIITCKQSHQSSSSNRLTLLYYIFSTTECNYCCSL